MALSDIAPLTRGVPSVDSTIREPVATGGERSGFADALGKALSSVEAQQLEADRNAEKVALGGGNLHETALALEKADIAMRVAMKVRNKLVEAYQEVMRMTV